MAERFWVGNGGDWDDTAHWSTASGGASGASVPTSSDLVYINASSFSLDNEEITMSAAVAFLSADIDPDRPIVWTTNSYPITTYQGGLFKGIIWRYWNGSVMNLGDSIVTLGAGGQVLIQANTDNANFVFNGTSAVVNLTTGTQAGFLYNGGYSSQFANYGLISGTLGTLNCNGVNQVGGGGQSSLVITNLNIAAGSTISFLTDTSYNNTIFTGTIVANGTGVDAITLKRGGAGSVKLSASVVSISYATVSFITALGAAIPFSDDFGTDDGGNINWLFPSASRSPSSSVSPSASASRSVSPSASLSPSTSVSPSMSSSQSESPSASVSPSPPPYRIVTRIQPRGSMYTHKGVGTVGSKGQKPIGRMTHGNSPVGRTGKSL